MKKTDEVLGCLKALKRRLKYLKQRAQRGEGIEDLAGALAICEGYTVVIARAIAENKRRGWE